MKLTLKNTLKTLTMLSTGFFIFSSEVALASGYKRAEPKPVATSGIGFEQYPLLGNVKKDVDDAMSIHRTGISFPMEKEQLKEHHASVEKYDEIVRRLEQNTQCNISLMNELFEDGNNVWKNVAAYAEDASAILLAEASESLGTAEASNQLKEVEAGNTSAAGSSDSKYSNFDANTTKSQADAMVSQDKNAAEAEYESAMDEAEESGADMDLGKASAYGKVRWDVGFTVLKDIYRQPAKWGTVKQRLLPWIDQKRIYDVYLEKFYREIEEHYIANPARPFPLAPAMEPDASYLPEDNYEGEVPEITVSSEDYHEIIATVNERWCGQTDGKKNVCTRINKGPLYMKHMMYVNQLAGYQRNTELPPPNLQPPYLPQAPLPPWRESVYIVSAVKQLPQIASNLPDPWFKVTRDIDNYTPVGELSNLVERFGMTIRYRPIDYNPETGEIRKDSHGVPRLPIPLTSNRISSYLALLTAKEEQEPIKDKALVSIKEMNEKMVASLKALGCVIPNEEAFDLSKTEDYKLAVNELQRIKQQKISSAQAKIQNMRATFGGKLLPSVEQMLAEEETALNALQKDTSFLVDIKRENAPDINSLLMTAIADGIANETYKGKVESQMEGAVSVPTVGCPVL